ncbi:MAG: ThiF family adenylyltransferase [Candidatus Wallbacteria bacterium]|nr:ThiF family adenylyltransferase [Candidatus Wallbacteria bacterium]
MIAQTVAHSMATDALYLDDQDRYSRLRLISWWDQERLRGARLMVVGAGALGNEVLKNLALLGVGRIYVLDLDCVENSNLSRSVLFRVTDEGKPKAQAAARALSELNPDVAVEARRANVITDVGLGVFREMDVVVGCLDNREARLWVNRSCWKAGVTWIDGAIQEIAGVMKVFSPPDGSCYECTMTEADYRLINLRYSCPLLRHEDLVQGKVPTAPTISSIVAGLQTQEALKLLHGFRDFAGKGLVVSGMGNNFYTTAFPRKESCLSHETYPAIESLELSSEESRAEDLFTASRELFGETRGALKLTLDRDLLVKVECPPCGISREVMRPLAKVSHQEAICPGCGEVMSTDIASEVLEGSPLAQRQLAGLGIPAYDVVRVSRADESRFVCLAADRARALGAVA